MERIKRISEKTGANIENIEKSFDLSNQAITDIKNHIKSEIKDKEIKNIYDIVCFGSLARKEITTQSDLDYIIVSHQFPKNRQQIDFRNVLISAVKNAQEKANLSGPGSTGMFGGIVSAPDFVEKIGLEHDTNLSHSRRCLLLMESISLYDDNLYEELLKAIIQRYLFDYNHSDKNEKIPRFLLNDIIKYWRTITVDYQAKRWRDHTESSTIRYLKLLITRKISYAGTLATILKSSDISYNKSFDEYIHTILNYFVLEFSKSPLERLLKIYDEEKLWLQNNLKSQVKSILDISNEFNEKLGCEDFRNNVKDLDINDENNKDFSYMKNKAKDLQSNLENLFFKTSIAEISKKYLSF